MSNQGTRAVPGAAKISTANPIEMNVSETPEIADSIAARGTIFRSVSTKGTPMSSRRAKTAAAARPVS